MHAHTDLLTCKVHKPITTVCVVCQCVVCQCVVCQCVVCQCAKVLYPGPRIHDFCTEYHWQTTYAYAWTHRPPGVGSSPVVKAFLLPSIESLPLFILHQNISKLLGSGSFTYWHPINNKTWSNYLNSPSVLGYAWSKFLCVNPEFL